MLYAFRERCMLQENAILVLNGLPRHLDQARDMAGIVRVGAVVVLECTAEDIVERIRSNTGGDRSDRTDDGIEMVGKKLEIFYQRTLPLIDFYERAGCMVVRSTVSASSTADQVYQQLLPDFQFRK